MWSSVIFLLAIYGMVRARIYSEGDVRLIGGQRRYMGTVAIYHEKKWGAICDKDWDRQDATVVCRQLGYSRAVKASIGSEFGTGNKRMWLSAVQCKGDESRVSDCPSGGFNISTRDYCPGRSRSSGVICSAAIVKTKIMRDSPQKVPATISLSTVLPVVNYSKKLAQISTSFNNVNESKNVLISNKTEKSKNTEQNISVLKTTTVMHTQQTTSIVKEIQTQQTTPIEKEVQTQQTDSSQKVTTSPFIESKPLTEFEASIQVLHTESVNETLMLPADAPQEQSNLEIRLQGGRYKWEGHLEVRVGNDPWMTICADFWTLRETIVACHQLKDIGKAKQALMTNYFGGEDMNKGYYRIQCTGRESTIGECQITKTDKTHVCSKKSSVAGVVCSHHLPDLVPNLRAVEDSVRLQDQPLYYLRCSMEENCLSQSAYTIYNTSAAWRNNLRRLLRFSTVVHNKGLADFKPYLPRGQWQWHSCHMHYHSMEIFAHYDILDGNGKRLAQGSKASFCLEDSACDKGVHPQFNCKGYAEQGLSVNCSDNYLYDIDCQWIDITDIKPGDYTFLIEINPDLLVAESNFDNNIVHCRLYYNGYFASLRNCHYESLLDFRKP